MPNSNHCGLWPSEQWTSIPRDLRWPVWHVTSKLQTPAFRRRWQSVAQKIPVRSAWLWFEARWFFKLHLIKGAPFQHPAEFDMTKGFWSQWKCNTTGPCKRNSNNPPCCCACPSQTLLRCQICASHGLHAPRYSWAKSQLVAWDVQDRPEKRTNLQICQRRTGCK